MTVEAVENPKVKPKDAPEDRSPVACETDLSQNQTVKKEEVCTATTLPAMTIMDPADPSKPALSDTAIRAANKDITDALNPGLFSSVGFDKIKNTIISMNGSDMQRLESSFGRPGEGGALRKSLQEKLSPAQFREVEALLDRKNGKPNLVGNIATAIEVSNQSDQVSHETAGRMLRSTVGILTGEQLAALKKDWNESKYARRYGNFDEAVQNAGFNDSDKQLMKGVFGKGSNQRTAEDIAAAAKLVVNTYNTNESTSSNADQYLRQLSDVLAGDSPAAVAARKALQGDKTFMAAYDKAFGPSTWANDTQKRVAQDLLSEGRISLSTIVSGNTKVLAGFFDNPDVISGALAKATPKEQADFLAGRKLAAENRDPSKLTPEQKDQLAYFKKLDETFRDRGGERQAAAWTEQLMYGKKSLISEAAATHSDGGLFGIGSGHSPDALAKVFENMTPQQWEMIRRKDNKESPYLTDLKTSLSKYVSGPELERINKMLDDKSRAKSFDDSQKTRRSLDQVAADVAGNPDARQSLAQRVLTMTATEAEQYKKDPEMRKRVGDVLDQPGGDQQSMAATVLAQSLLKQVEQTGKPVSQLNPTQQFAKDLMDGKLDTPTKQIDAAEKLVLGDPALRARLNEIQNMRDKGTLSSDFKLSQEDINLSGLLMSSTSQFGYRNLLRGEQIGIGEKIAAGGGVLGEGFKGRYPDIAKIEPQSERERIIGMLSPQQQEIARNVVKQGGTADMADEARSYLVGDGGNYREFVDRLGKMSDADRANFFKTFEAKYGKDFKAAFVEGAVKRDGLGSDHKVVLDKLASQNFKPTLADELRLKVLDGKNAPYQPFEDRLKALNPAQVQQLKSEYSQKYGSSLDGDLLGQIDNAGAKITFERMLKGAPTDPVSEFLERTATIDLTGANYDGSQINMERALQVNRDLITQYQANRAKMTPEMRDRMDKYFTEATQQNLDHKEWVAKQKQLAMDLVVASAAIVSIAATFGGSTPLVVGASAVGMGTSAYRPFAMSDALGSKTITAEEFRAQAIRGGIDAALFAPVGALGRVATMYNEITTGTRAAETVNALLKAEQGVPAALRIEQALPSAQKLEQVVANGTRVASVERTAPVVAAVERDAAVVPAVVAKVDKPLVVADEAAVVPAVVAKVEKPLVVADEAAVVPAVVARVEKPLVVADEAAVVPAVVARVEKPLVVADDAAGTLVRANSEATALVERQAIATAAAKGDEAALAALKVEDRALLAKLAESGDSGAVKALQSFDRNQLAAAVARGEKPAAELAAFDRKVLEQAAAAGDRQAAAKIIELDRAPLLKAAEAGDQAAVKALQAFDRKVLEAAAARGDARAIEALAAIRKSEATAATVAKGILTTDVMRQSGLLPEVALRHVERLQAEDPKPTEKPLAPSDKLLELATVRRGEGPWQTAERILATDGKKHSVDEVRALTKAIQAAYKLDNNGSGDMSGLKVKYSFAGTSANTFSNIVANCKDDKVKAILLSLAKS